MSWAPHLPLLFHCPLEHLCILVKIPQTSQLWQCLRPSASLSQLPLLNNGEQVFNQTWDKKMGIFPKNFDMYFSVLINVDSCSHPIESIFLCDLVQVLYPALLNKFCALFLYVLPIQVLLECHKIYHPLTKNSRFLFTTFHMKFNPFISAHRVPCFSTSVVSLALFLIFS